MKKTFSIITFSVLSILASQVLANTSDSTQNKKRGEIEFEAKENYLLVPMFGHTNHRNIALIDAETGDVIAQYPKALLSFADKGDLQNMWSVPIDISKYKGRKLIFKFLPENDWEPKLRQGNLPPRKDYASMQGRPSYHFTAPNGWLNDPNGLVYFKGMWHLFYQHQPFSMVWADGMYWGHAVSKDLVNWEYKEPVLKPQFDAKGNVKSAFSGSAYYDKDNKSGLFKGKDGGVVFAYTRTGSGEHIMYSEDLVNFEELNSVNPIITSPGRDPRIFFNEDSGLWTIVRYEEFNVGKNDLVWRINESGYVQEKSEGHKKRRVFAIYVSKDLKSWERTCEFAEGFYECPEFVKMPVSGRDEWKWVVSDAAGNYLVGDFDGRVFKQISKQPLRLFFGKSYAMQYFANAPENRTIAMSWIQNIGPLLQDVGQGFSQCLSMPWGLRLAQLKDGEYQLRAYVPYEIETKIAQKGWNAVGIADMTFKNNVYSLPHASGNKYVLAGKVFCAYAEIVRIEIGTSVFSIDVKNGRYAVGRIGEEPKEYNAQIKDNSGILEFRAFVDTYSAEIILNSGEAVLTAGDSFINPEQIIKIGAKGSIVVEEIYAYDVNKPSVKKNLKKVEQKNNPETPIEKK